MRGCEYVLKYCVLGILRAAGILGASLHRRPIHESQSAPYLSETLLAGRPGAGIAQGPNGRCLHLEVPAQSSGHAGRPRHRDHRRRWCVVVRRLCLQAARSLPSRGGKYLLDLSGLPNSSGGASSCAIVLWSSARSPARANMEQSISPWISLGTKVLLRSIWSSSPGEHGSSGSPTRSSTGTVP